MKLKQQQTKNPNFILNMASSVTAIAFFASGIGSYRVFLVYALHCFMRALNIEQKIIFLFLPAYLFLFYIDVTAGPIFMQSKTPIFFVMLLAFVIVDSLAQKMIKKTISKATQNQFFVECPSCRFHNLNLVERCANCSYKKGDSMTVLTSPLSPDFKGDQIPSGLMPLLGLENDEKIVFHKKLTISSQQLKNGERIVRKHFVITTINLIMVDYEFFHVQIPRAWRERDVIPLLEISAAEGKMKEFMNGICPFLILKTANNDIYEIVFSTTDDYIPQIKQISEIIQKANPRTNVEINLYDTALTKFVKKIRSFMQTKGK